MDYYNDLWIGYLAALLIRKCAELSVLRCPGCRDKLKSPILHLHYQHCLLDKLRLYFDDIRELVLPVVDDIYAQVQTSLPHSTDRKKDKEVYTNNARHFLSTVNPDALYWGRYIDDGNDAIIYELLSKKKKYTIDLTKIFLDS